jgi:uncharacterized protein YvpB
VRLTKPVRRPVKKPNEKPSVRLSRTWDVDPADVLEEALARVPDVELGEEPNREPDAELDAKPNKEPDAESKARHDRKPRKKPDVKPNVDLDAKSDKKPEAKPNKKPDAKPDKKPDVKPNEESKGDPDDSLEDDSKSDSENNTENNLESNSENSFEETSLEEPLDKTPNEDSKETPDEDPNESPHEPPNPLASGELVWVLADEGSDESFDENSDENSNENPNESSNESLTAHFPPLQACMRITESMGEHLRHLMSLFKLFGTASVAFVLVLSFIGWLKVDGSQAIVRDDSEPMSTITVVENVVPKASALLQDASDATKESAEALIDAANAARAGWHEENGDRYYYYTDGTMARGAVEIDGVAVTFDDEGRWVSSRLDAPYISQLPDMPSGCEVVSVTMMLNHAGVIVSKEDVAAQLPYSSDPAQGFTGNVYDEGTYDNGGIVWPSALLELVRGYKGSAVDLTGESWETLRGFIDQGRTVCIWFTNDGLDHTVLLVGYSATTVWVNDPLVDKDVALDIDEFLRYWEQNGYRALSW